jgi:hypothetical protein
MFLHNTSKDGWGKIKLLEKSDKVYNNPDINGLFTHILLFSRELNN